uniref:EOG090X094T n=1 Tax=Daphnia sinensis TaxID=1820382 RepID=A0A4Y7NBX6_9CRUS|nr:EOG090X094T [Daphnia sinensis]
MHCKEEESPSSRSSSSLQQDISNYFPTSIKLSSYVEALRPWSFSASLMPVLLGCAIAHKATGEFSPIVLILTALCALSVHAAGNLVNTYFDFIKGIDNKQKSDDRTLVDQLLSKDEVATLGAVLYGLGCVGFIALVFLSPARMEHLALVYFGGLSSSFLYTGGIGFKYIALGDVMILIIFGPITLLFSYLAQSGQTEWATIWYAIPLALNTEAILHSNNTRDMNTDRRAGIVTLAILIGTPASIVLFACLLFLPYMVFVVLALHYSKWLLLPLVTLPSAFRLEKEFRSEDMRHIPKKTAKLNFFFALLYVLAIGLCPSSELPLFSH